MGIKFRQIVVELKRQERRLAAQLKKVREAISLLEFGGGGIPAPAVIDTPQAVRLPAKRRRRTPAKRQMRLRTPRRR
jgi:hypothetical protein